jgi:hypothetical protein
MAKIDFAEIKATVSLEKAAEFLGLELKRTGDAHVLNVRRAAIVASSSHQVRDFIVSV